MTLTPSSLLSKGIILLLQTQPFYASLVLRMNIEASESIDTACTDGKDIWYRPAFISSLNVREVAGLLAHEVLHVANFHHTRRGRRDPKKWNYACDYAINPILLEAGMTLPEGGLVDDRFYRLSAEQIYARLPDPPPNAPTGFGEVVDHPGQTGTKNASEAAVRSALAQALTVARMRGQVSEDLLRLVKTALQPKVDWREALAAFMTETTLGDYTWTKPAPRFLHQGLYLPTQACLEKGSIVLLVDTSCSIDQPILDLFATEVTCIAGTFQVSLTILYVDSEVRSVQTFEPGEDIDLQPRGGGGTDFKPGFDYLTEHQLQPHALVYLTDGECTSFPEAPDFPVLWAQFGYSDFSPPFGQVIQIHAQP